VDAEGFMVMYEYYQNWGSVARRAYKEGLNASIPTNYYMSDKILFCGMGGSGIAGHYADHVLKSIGSRRLSESINGYRLPFWVNRRTLVFAISFSGNTEETLRCAHNALQRGAKVALISRGGMMEDLARERGLLFFRVPEAPAPRAGLPSLLYSILGILANMNVFDPNDAGVEDSITMLSDEVAQALDYSESFAFKLYKSKGKPIIVATGDTLSPVVVRAKNEFAENTKMPVYIGVFPESGHNDIEAWARLEEKAIILVRTGDPAEDAMLDAAVDTIEPEPIIEIKPRSGLLAGLMWPTWILGLVSLHLANLLGVDAYNIPYISRYKKAFKSRVSHA